MRIEGYTFFSVPHAGGTILEDLWILPLTMPGLRCTFFRADLGHRQRVLGEVSALLQNGSEYLGSGALPLPDAIADGVKSGWASPPLRILPSQFRQFPAGEDEILKKEAAEYGWAEGECRSIAEGKAPNKNGSK